MALDRPGAIRVSGLEAIERLRVVAGEADKILTAALKDLAADAVDGPDGIRENWPVLSGDSKAGWYWSVADDASDFFIGNTMEYTPYVWGNLLSGPVEDFWIKSVEAALYPLLDDVEAALFEKVRSLLEVGGEP